MADQPAPAPVAPDTYQPAVFVPPVADDGEQIVDSKTGKSWHLATQDPELRALIYSGEVGPVLKKNFKAPGTAGEQELPSAA